MTSVPETDKCKLYEERRDWPGNSQGPLKVRTKSMGSQRKYLIQARSWGGPFNLIVTEPSDFRLKEFCAEFAGLMGVLCFVPLLWHDKVHLLLFAVYKENVEEWCKNLRAVILILVFMTADIYQAPEYSQGFYNLSPPPSLWFGCLYLRTATFWCSGVTLVRLLGKRCEKPPWGLHSLPCEIPSGSGPCFKLLL